MSIAPAIREHYPQLNEAQRAIVGHLDGPLLVIAGPGSGKTQSIVLRALNLLLLEKAQPRELVLCTYTEKAAFEMRDRLAAVARKVGYTRDLSELTASTIHSFCNRVLTQHRHRTELGHIFDTLDELTQLLFLFERFDEVIGPPENDLFLLRWKTRWTAIEGARGYFDKITEELVDPEQLTRSGDSFLVAMGVAYRRYERSLLGANRTDFAHLQRLVYDLLGDRATAEAVTRDVRYVLVDEYQDTNYIQEQLLLKLIRYIELDVQVIQEVIAQADIPGDRSFRPGRRAFLAKSQFDRYERTADQMFGRLRYLLRATHRLDRLLPSISNDEFTQVGPTLADLQGQLEHAILDKEQSIDDAIESLLSIVRKLRKAIDSLILQLTDSPNPKGRLK